MVKLTKKELTEYRKLLNKEKQKLVEEMDHLTNDSLKKSQKDASGDLSGYSYHMADMATDHYDREFSLGLASGEQKTLFQIDEALKRIQDGSYGKCVECEKMIPKRRLKALPHAQYCLDCQKDAEKGGPAR